MHPALMIAVMEERDRELRRRTKDAWRQVERPSRHPAPRKQEHRGRGRLSTAFARSLAFFG
jgi:hypothetical protein